MRFRISLVLDVEKSGNILPISYQHELVTEVERLFMSNVSRFSEWLKSNGFSLQDNEQCSLYSISNLYIPRIFVQGDRLHINVPRIQFWISFYPTNGTAEFLKDTLENQKITIGDKVSSVSFTVTEVNPVAPVTFYPVMEYQTLSPLVIIGVRPNNTIEYLNPHNPYFPEFLIDETIARWEMINHRKYMGDRRFHFELLAPERRKAVTVHAGTEHQQKVVGYMLKYRLSMAPELHEIAYTLGFGDKMNLGFGYVELLKKEYH